MKLMLSLDVSTSWPASVGAICHGFLFTSGLASNVTFFVSNWSASRCHSISSRNGLSPFRPFYLSPSFLSSRDIFCVFGTFSGFHSVRTHCVTVTPWECPSHHPPLLATPTPPVPDLRSLGWTDSSSNLYPCPSLILFFCPSVFEVHIRNIFIEVVRS